MKTYIIYTTGYRDNCRYATSLVFHKERVTGRELKRLQCLYRDAEDHYEIIDWLESHGFKPLKPVKSKKLEEHESHPFYDISWTDIYEITEDMLPIVVVSYRCNYCYGGENEYWFWLDVVDSSNISEWTNSPFGYKIPLSKIIEDGTVVENKSNIDINASNILCRRVANIIGDLREENYETYECIDSNGKELYIVKEYAIVVSAEVGTRKIYLKKPNIYIS